MNITKEYILDLFDRAAKKHDYTWGTYQPINCPGYEITLIQSGRKCVDRSTTIINHIKNNISDYQNYTYIDWGCNLGYFVFDLMKSGMQAFGVDRKKEYIDICNFIASEHSGANYKIPNFFVDDLSVETIKKYPHNIGLCFSVFHHFKKDQFKILLEFSKYYDQAYIEMDGHNYGYDFLKVFYWNLNLVTEANDKYGNGTRKRKTWFCNNKHDNNIYKNIKINNLLSGRSAFKKTNILTGKNTFIKRENLSFEHTWIKTNIAYEINLYQKYSSEIFLPHLINYDQSNKERILETEYIDSSSQKGESIENIFAWLSRENLHIVDCSPSQFIKTQGNKYVMVDLESIVPNSEIESRIKSQNKKSIIKSKDEQIQFLNKSFGIL